MAAQSEVGGYGTIGMGWMTSKSSSLLEDPGQFAVIKSRFQTYAEAVHRILQTAPYERPLEPFGSLCRRLLFEPNDFYLQRAADYAIRDALRRYEPRLDLAAVEMTVDKANKRISFKLTLVEKASQTRFVLEEEVQL